MKGKRMVGLCILMCLCCLATGVMAITYTWTGDGFTPAWDLNDNWSITFCGQRDCYPDSTDDDAIFPMGADWQCGLVSVTIDDLTIRRDVDFDAEDTDPVLRVDTLTIVGRNGPGTVATVTDGAEITTVPPPP